MPVNEKSLIIRKAEIRDIEFVKEIEIECGLSHWSLFDYNAELTRTDSIFLVGEIDSKISGFLLARLITKLQTDNNKLLFEINNNQLESTKVDKTNSDIESEFENVSFETELYNIGVRPAHRRAKIGYCLMKTLIEDAKQYKADAIFLEVRKSNISAINFYRNFYFSDIYERKNLYTNPVENGLGMKLDLSIQNERLDMKCL